MNMVASLELLEQSVSELEDAAYGHACVGSDKEQIEHIQYLYSRKAKGPNCKQTTLSLLEPISKLVRGVVRREHHIDSYGEHYFLSIPVIGERVLAACDLIVDPTYQQFLRPEFMGGTELPNIFIGSRLAAFELMHTPLFDYWKQASEDLGTSPEIYLQETLCALESREVA